MIANIALFIDIMTKDSHNRSMRYSLLLCYFLIFVGCVPANNDLPPLMEPLQLSFSAAPTDAPTSIATLQPTQLLPTPTLILQPTKIKSRPTPTPLPSQTPKVSTESQGDLNIQSSLAIDHQTDFLLTEGEADVIIGVDEGVGVGRWVFAVVAPFYTVRDEITLGEVQAAWESGRVVVSADTLPFLTPRWGATTLIVESTRDRLWAGDATIGIVPFDQLTPDLKVLRVDGQTPLERELNLDHYPLAIPLTATGDSGKVADFQANLSQPITNWRSEKMTTIAMTGVTALVRATAYNMELNGLLWAGEEVREVLRSADFAHISNEVAFLDNCPYPNPVGGTSFCSSTRYFTLLEDIGTDIIELTGNHVNDYGAESFADDFSLYEDRNMKTFGGGENSTTAARPLKLEHNGNRIALLGCNEIGPAYAWATETTAGARPCDGTLTTQIKQLVSEGYATIVTLQYHEFYFYEPTYQQTLDFRAYADAGAIIVSGSQGHHAQGFDLYGDSFIHYGLGNLFFDQMNMLGTRQAFVDEYTFYDGQLLSVELWTGLIENYARPRLMSDVERQQLLQTVFNVSLRE